LTAAVFGYTRGMDIQRVRGEVGGIIAAPSSKSHMQRVIAAGTMAAGVTRLEYATTCADSEAALRVAESLGAEVWRGRDAIEIKGAPGFAGEFRGAEAAGVSVVQPDGELRLSCGESGLCMRMFAPIAALLGRTVVMEASGSLRERSMRMIEAIVPEFGVAVQTEGGRAPLRLSGRLHGGSLCMEAGESSQLLTGLLMALPLTRPKSLLSVYSAASRGYLDLTMAVCGKFGVNISRNKSYSQFAIPGGQHYTAAEALVEGDWSAGAFLVVMGAVAGAAGGLTIVGLDKESAQPDRAIVEAAKSAGAKIGIEGRNLIVKKDRLRAFTFDATDCPDLFPPLVVLATACPGRSAIKGVHRLRGKESDRAESLTAMTTALGGAAWMEDDSLCVEGRALTGGRVDPRNDHRIAMAAETASLLCSGGVTIADSECVGKSWPGFFDAIDAIRR